MIRIAKLSMAHVHARGYTNQIRDNSETELVAIWDEEEYGGKQAAEDYDVPYYDDLDQVLSRDDIDAVVVDAITSDHPRVMVAAAEAGKHIFTEKALAIDVDGCDQIISSVKKSGVKFMISMPQRCDGGIQLVKKVVDDGLLGDITFGRFRIAHSAGLDKWFSGPSAWFGVMSWSTKWTIANIACEMIVGPPAAPTVKTGLPSRSTMVGLMLESGRLPGDTAFASAPISPKALGAPGCAEKSSISLFITMPVPGMTTPEPKEVFTVAVQATHQPSESAAEK